MITEQFEPGYRLINGTQLNALVAQANPQTADVTSGPVAPDVSPVYSVVTITSSGSAGEEFVNVQSPADIGADPNDFIGQRMVLIFAAQADPADTITLQRSGSNAFGQSLLGQVRLPAISKLSLAAEGQIAVLEWDGVGSWTFVPWATALGATTEYGFTQAVSVNGAGAVTASEAAGGAVEINGGTGDGAGNGGNIQLLPGNSGVTAGAKGGNLTLDGGFGAGAGDDGLVVIGSIIPLPTAAPATSGAIWRDAVTNILHVTP